MKNNLNPWLLGRGITTFKNNVFSIKTVIQNGQIKIIASGDSQNGKLNVFNLNDFNRDAITSMNYFLLNIYEKY